MSVGLDRFFKLLEIKSVIINVIGSSPRVEHTLEMIDIRYIPNSNRKLRTRLKDTFLDIMIDKLKEEHVYEG